MSDVTRLLDDAAAGDPQAAADLLPLVYDELRRLAAAHLSAEAPGQSLTATALVHEAYVRLVGGGDDRRYADRGHFFAVAATAMRRVLVDNARRKRTLKRGGGGWPGIRTDAQFSTARVVVRRGRRPGLVLGPAVGAPPSDPDVRRPG